MRSTSRWIEAHWLENALAWIDAQLRVNGSHRLGLVEQPHLTGSTTVLRVPTPEGDVYFKAVTPAFHFEIRLTEYLAQKWPAIAPRLLACDADKGWMLMQDGGCRLRELLQDEPDMERWKSVLSLYSRLQQKTMQHASKLLELGIPDRRPEVLLERFNQFLAHPDQLVCDELSRSDVDRLLESQQEIEYCRGELAGLGIDACLDHGDFHDGNIFVEEGTYIFFDWGDAGLTHPFFSLRTAFVSLENSLGLEEDNPIFGQLSDHYLMHWADWASIEKLRRAYLLSRPLASISAAIRWQAAIDDLDQEDQAAYQSYVPSLLGEVLPGLMDLKL